MNNLLFRADLFTCTKEILDGKILFLCIVTAGFNWVYRYCNVRERVFVLAFICWLFQGAPFIFTIE